jgi:Tfp pilus assembly protein PilF
MHNVFGLLQRVTLAVAGAALIACGTNAGSGSAATIKADPDSVTMARGLDLLYKRSDPIGAEAAFREVLQRNPTHYGAEYQLAVALDRGGKPAEARTAWDAALKNAVAINDTTSTRTARARLAAPDTASLEAMMVLGLDLLRRQNNPTAAVEQFRKVLQRNPTHYGATYQLATALDKAGLPAQARPVWVKMLGMATAIKDTATMQTARLRLGANR